MSRVAGQTSEARTRRLAEGRCPIHGTQMYQVGNDVVIDGRRYTYLAECTRKRCAMQGGTDRPFGPLVLTEASVRRLQFGRIGR